MLVILMPFGLTDAGTAGGTNAIYERCNPRLVAMCLTSPRVYGGRALPCFFLEMNPARAVEGRRGAVKQSTDTSRSTTKDGGTGSCEGSPVCIHDCLSPASQKRSRAVDRAQATQRHNLSVIYVIAAASKLQYKTLPA